MSQGCCEIDVMFSSDLYIATGANFGKTRKHDAGVGRGSSSLRPPSGTAAEGQTRYKQFRIMAESRPGDCNSLLHL
jgi:hypothetical protein